MDLSSASFTKVHVAILKRNAVISTSLFAALMEKPTIICVNMKKWVFYSKFESLLGSTFYQRNERFPKNKIRSYTSYFPSKKAACLSYGISIAYKGECKSGENVQMMKYLTIFNQSFCIHVLPNKSSTIKALIFSSSKEIAVNHLASRHVERERCGKISKYLLGAFQNICWYYCFYWTFPKPYSPI